MPDDDIPRFETVEEADAWAERHRLYGDPPPPIAFWPNEPGERPHAVPTWDPTTNYYNHMRCGFCCEPIKIYGVDDAGRQHYRHISSGEYLEPGDEAELEFCGG